MGLAPAADGSPTGLAAASITPKGLDASATPTGSGGRSKMADEGTGAWAVGTSWAYARAQASLHAGP